MDEIYEFIFVKLLNRVSNFIERVINSFIIESVVEVIILIYAKSSNLFLRTQIGQIRVYLFYMILGISIMFIYFMKF